MRGDGTLCPRRKMGADGRLLQLLYNGAHRISMLSSICAQGRRRILDLEPARGHNRFQVSEEVGGILLGPEVDIQAMQLIQILLLVPLIVAREMPLGLILRVCIDF